MFLCFRIRKEKQKFHSRSGSFQNTQMRSAELFALKHAEYIVHNHQKEKKRD